MITAAPSELADEELRQLDTQVEAALSAGDENALPTLGYGEISLVLAWPSGSPTVACKRLPVFPSRGRFDSYQQTLDAYLGALRAAGIRVVETEMRAVPRRDGTVVGYVVQPILPAETLAPALLARSDTDTGHPLVAAVVEAAARTVTPRVGLDAQLDNWAWDEQGLIYFDVSTPMMWTQDGQPMLDLGPLSAAFPWLVRAPLRRFVAPGILDTYRDLPGVYLDLCGNLIKQRLEAWLPAFLAEVGSHLAEPPTDSEVRRYYRRDARLWELLLRIRRLDRAWQRRVRRRPYPFLLPKDTER